MNRRGVAVHNYYEDHKTHICVFGLSHPCRFLPFRHRPVCLRLAAETLTCRLSGARWSFLPSVQVGCRFRASRRNMSIRSQRNTRAKTSQSISSRRIRPIQDRSNYATDQQLRQWVTSKGLSILVLAIRKAAAIAAKVRHRPATLVRCLG